MEHVGITGNGGRVFHCPRCGTLRQIFAADPDSHDYVPKLVGHCLELLARSGDEIPDDLSHALAAAVVPPEPDERSRRR
jgi:hypothetical protein